MHDRVSFFGKNTGNRCIRKALLASLVVLVCCVCPYTPASADQLSDGTALQPQKTAEITGKCGTNATYTLKDQDGDGAYEALAIQGEGEVTASPWRSETIPELFGLWNGNATLCSVVVGEGITVLPEDAFRNCVSLQSVSLPKSLTTVSDRAFLDCGSLKEVTIAGGSGSKLNQIGYYAFGGCSALEKFTVPEVNTLGDLALADCITLREAVFLGACPKSVGSYCFLNAKATVQHPMSGWTDQQKGQYGGSLVWKMNQLLTPELAGVANEFGGVKLTWKAVEGATMYQVLRRTYDEDWEAVGYTKSKTYLDTKVESGKKYLYTVSCVTEKKHLQLSEFDDLGRVALRLDTPTILSAENLPEGLLLTWGAIPGAKKYQVYRRDNTGTRTELLTVTDSMCLDKTAEDGKTYWYDIVSLTADGFTRSGADTVGFEATYTKSQYRYSAPELLGIGFEGENIRFDWKKVDGVCTYCVMRKKAGESWKTVCYTTDATYLDENTESGTEYSYTVRCVSDSEHEPLSDYNEAGWTIHTPVDPTIEGPDR